MLKKIFPCFIILYFLVSTFVAAKPADYTYSKEHFYNEVFGSGNLIAGNKTDVKVFASSPARTKDSKGNLLDDWIRINSNTNQPRDFGNNLLHDGTDLQMKDPRVVYSIYSGKVVKIDPSRTKKQLMYIFVQLDINNDKVLDNYYVNYLHINPYKAGDSGATYVKEGDCVDKNTVIARIDIKRPNGFPSHLHLAVYNGTGLWGQGSQNLKLANFYLNSPTSWGNGEALDYLSNATWNVKIGAPAGAMANTLNISGYSCDSDTTPFQNQLKRVEVYYKVDNGSWSDTPKLMTRVQPNVSTNFRWAFDFSSISGVGPGSKISFYLAGIRDEIQSFWFNYGLWPQYYKMPPKLPTKFSAGKGTPIQYVTMTVK